MCAWPILVLSLFLTSEASSGSAKVPEKLFHFRDPDFVYGAALPSLLAELSVDPEVRISVAMTGLKALTVGSDSAMEQSTPAKVGSNELTALVVREGLRAGMDPSYLVKLAYRESRFDPFADSPTSTASGMYQFTDNTWLCSLRDFGPPYAIARSYEIRRNRQGVCETSSHAEHVRLLALRSDPTISTRIAAAFSLRNYRILSAQFGRPPTTTELYILHFFGESSGLRFLQAAASTPWVSANALNRGAAASNPGIFFNASGRPKNVADVFENLRLP